MRISRRTLIAGAAASIPLPHFLPRRLADEVIIIGAGAAGLAAAKVLKDQQVPFRILEARNRIGGRVNAPRTLSAPIDLGAAWVHGTNGNPLKDLVAQNGISLQPFDGSKTQLYRGGQPIEADVMAEIDTAYGDFVAYLDRVTDEPGKAQNIEDIYKAFENENKSSPEMKQARDWFVAADLELERGTALSDLSASGWNEVETYPGLDCIPSSTFGGLFQTLAKGMPIQFGEVVSKIESFADLAKVTTNKGTYSAKDVICTIPLGVLQTGGVTILPGFDDARTAAMKRLRVGSFNKIALQFAEEFWPQDVQRLGVLQPGEGRGVFEIWNLSPHTGQPILVLQSGGAFAKQLETLDDAGMVAKAMATLKSMFGGTVAVPEKSAVTRWTSDPFSRGCFTHIPPGASIADVKAMGEQQGRIHFAGEHTSTYVGALHGALLSGRLVAQEVLA